MKCQSKHKDWLYIECCRDEATKKIIITTFVPHLNMKKQVRTRCLCNFHAKRLRNKLNREINQMGKKNKSYIEENL